MPDDQPDEGLEALLDHLKEVRGFDFTGYKRASLSRRIRKRMSEVGEDRYDTYQALLERQPEEYGELFNMILINVTQFMRDPAAWEHLGAAVLPRIIEDKAPGEPIRVWSAGCASGEEPYSIAVLLVDQLGEDRFRRDVKIYGSDLDDDAIAQARQAR